MSEQTEATKEEGKRLLGDLARNESRLKSLIERGIVSERMKRYVEIVLEMDFNAWEAQTYARYGGVDEAKQSLIESLLSLNNIYEAFSTTESGVFNPGAMKEDYWPLVEFAKGRHVSLKREVFLILDGKLN